MTSVPKFAAGLPAGPGLDWAVRQRITTRVRLELNAAPSPQLVRELWDDIGDHDAATIVEVTDNADTLGWIAERCDGRDLLRRALLRNRHLPYQHLARLLIGTVSDADCSSVIRARSSEELTRLLLEVRGFRSSADLHQSERRVAHLLGAGAAASAEPETLTRAAATIAVERIGDLLRGALSVEPDKQQVDTNELLKLTEAHTEILQADPASHTLWHGIAARVAEAGSDADVNRLVDLGSDPVVRAVLLAHRRLDVAQATAGVSGPVVVGILIQASEVRQFDREDAAELLTVGLTAETVHRLNFEPDAAAWLSEHGDPDVAGAAVWQVASDLRLARALATNAGSRRWAGYHLWRLGRIWDRLSARTRHGVINALPPTYLLEITSGNVREWLISDGPSSAVLPLTLRRNEIRILIERVRVGSDAPLAWKAANAAERPRDRVASAAAAMAASRPGEELSRDAQLQNWARRSSSGEIVSLWNQLAMTARPAAGRALVAQLRGGDEGSWVGRIIGELTLRWQHTPDEVQEAAALWLARSIRDETTTWEAVWALYPEWEGTLVELLTAARYA